MTYTLLVGDPSHSSWSMRGWLSLDPFGIPFQLETTNLYSGHFKSDVAAFGATGTVPALRTPDGGILSDSLSIAWHLAEAFPDKGLLPSDPKDRAEAQSIIAEMHSGFTALRSACPMNLCTAWDDFTPSAEVLADLERIDAMWSAALERSGGPFLYGDYSLADAFYAPVATRIATYQLAMSKTAMAYVQAHLADLSFRRWRTIGAVFAPELGEYEMGLPRGGFPFVPTLPARAVEAGPSENALCPYSGKPVTDFAEIGGRVFGFCNPTCRDETVIDPEAWPAFMAIYHS